MSTAASTGAMLAPERLFRDDVTSGDFAAGVDRGYWNMLSLSWPIALIEVAAAPRENAPDGYVLRFDLSGYPDAPTAQLWDPQADAPLAVSQWPGGGERTLRAFNPAWNPNALYLPIDRLALLGHDAWRAIPGTHVWDPAGDITQYVRLVHELLNEDCYTGVRG
jgi:hypothetical protein